MKIEWDETRLLGLLPDIEERTDLEYKAAKGLEDKPRIRKHVSAMANSAGGTIIYGMKEKDVIGESGKVTKRIPDGLEDVTPSGVTKESLDQIIRGIQPPLNFEIEDVQVPSINGHVYVVKIPQGVTAHMADDNKHYKRLNFHVDAMEAYELRDIMNRVTTPAFEVSIFIKDQRVDDPYNQVLYFLIEHTSGPYAKYLQIDFKIPRYWNANVIDRTNWGSHITLVGAPAEKIDDTPIDIYRLDRVIPSNGGGVSVIPLLRGDKCEWAFALGHRFSIFDRGIHKDVPLSFKIFCDSAPPVEKSLTFKDIPWKG
jgi:hypothetical protein